ncbi:multidrug efflux SMR transporter [Chitinivorax tropicus]
MWGLLALAIIAETIATSSLKASAGMTRLVPTLMVVSGYVLSFWLLSQVLKTLEVGIVYAIWCGVGMAIVAVVGVVWFGEGLGWMKLCGLLLIMAGTVLLSLAGSGH